MQFVLACAMAFGVSFLSKVVPNISTWSLPSASVSPTCMEAISEVVGFSLKKINPVLVSFIRLFMYIQYMISLMLFSMNNFVCVFSGLKPYARMWSSAYPGKTECWSFVMLCWKELT